MYANVHGVVADHERRIARLEARLLAANDEPEPVDPDKPKPDPGQGQPKPQDPPPDPGQPDPAAKPLPDRARVPHKPRA